MVRSVSGATLVILAVWASAGGAQTGKVYTAADYAQAEKFMDYNVNSLVYHTVEDPTWLGDGRFWYRDSGPDGVTFMLVDPAKRMKAPAFDQGKITTALNDANSTANLGIASPVIAGRLPIDDFKFEDGDRSVLLKIGTKLVRCDLRGAGGCKSAGNVLPDLYVVSPDGK